MQLRDDQLISAEAVAESLLTAFIAAIVLPYSAARVGGAIQPWLVLIASAAASAAAWMWLRRSSVAGPPQAPVVTEDLFLAGRWARSNLPPVCVEYLVPQQLTPY